MAIRRIAYLSTFFCIAHAISAPLHAGFMPIGIAAPLMLPLITSHAPIHEAVHDALDFYHARELALTLHIPGSKAATQSGAPLEISYKLRWGYRGAGDKTEAFRGMQGNVNIQLSYDGLTFQLSRSRSIGATFQSIVGPLCTVSPCQEFYFKLLQLAWTVGQQKHADLTDIAESLTTLIERLKLTPGGETCKLYNVPILPSQTSPGLASYVQQAPQECAAQFVVISQKIAALYSLIAHTPSSEKEAYFKSLIHQIDYYASGPLTLNLPRGGHLVLPLPYGGSGDVDEPLEPLTISLQVPLTAQATQQMEWQLTLSPDHVCLLKLFLLFIHHRKSSLPFHTITKEISTLCLRYTTTSGTAAEDSFVGALLAYICQYHQSIITYSFDEPLNEILNTGDFVRQLLRIGYHAYLSDGTPQEVADFVTINLADALRCYDRLVSLRTRCGKKGEFGFLQKRGITIKWDLFTKRLLAAPPED